MWVTLQLDRFVVLRLWWPKNTYFVGPDRIKYSKPHIRDWMDFLINLFIYLLQCHQARICRILFRAMEVDFINRKKETKN